MTAIYHYEDMKTYIHLPQIVPVKFLEVVEQTFVNASLQLTYKSGYPPAQTVRHKASNWT